MLAPLLVTEDPYAAASTFSQAGWKLEYETARTDDRGRLPVSVAARPCRSARRHADPVDARR